MNYKSIENYSYTKLIFELIKAAERHHFDIKLIGKEKFKKINAEYPLYRFTINPKAKIKFGIGTGMHGDEIAGPLAMHFLFQNPQKYFHPDICYYIYPTISPTAFDLRRRYDDDNKELNSLSQKTLRNRAYHEIKCYYHDFRKLKFDAFLSIHEDVEQKKFYAYVNSNNQEVYEKIMANGQKHFGLMPHKKIDGHLTNSHGMITSTHDRSTEDWIYRHKKPLFSIVTETPAKNNDLNARIETDLQNIVIVNKFLAKHFKL